MDAIINTLLENPDPAVRYLTAARLGLPGHDLQAMQAKVKESQQVKALLAEQGADGTIPRPAYDKWMGAHWVLTQLAELGYPPGDETLRPLQEQMFVWVTGHLHRKYYRQRVVKGLVRMHPSVEGNLVWYSLKLGLHDERLEELADFIVNWQWPDGGWNCDMNPQTTISSFMESLIPLRALALYAEEKGDKKAAQAAARVPEIFLKRHLYKHLHDGAVMDRNFVRLHYPCYWHYDILFGLKVLAETGHINDPRCADALDLLESKRLPDGGWPAEAKYYQLNPASKSHCSPADWGGTSKKKMNPWVTVDALYVLRAAGRL